jgi:hypothetical protein
VIVAERPVSRTDGDTGSVTVKAGATVTAIGADATVTCGDELSVT